MNNNYRPIPLFRIPWIPLDVIFDLMSMEEMYNLYKCSKKSESVAKHYNWRHKYVAKWSLGHNESTFTFSDLKFYFLENYSIFIKTARRPFEDHLVLHLAELTNLFNPSIEVEITDFFRIRPLVSMMERFNIRLKTVNICSECTLSDHTVLYRFALNSFKDIPCFTLSPKAPPSFQYLDSPGFTCDRLVIESSSWVTIENIVNVFMDCKEVRFSRCPILPKIVYPIIQKWLQGSRNEEIVLEHSKKRVNKFPIEDITKDIPYWEVQRVKFRNDAEVFPVGYVIRRYDGVDAVICWNQWKFLLSTKFEILM